MKITITGRNEAVTAQMKDKAREKAEKLLKFYDRITWMDVVLDVDRERRRVEMTAGLNRGATVIGKAENADMYAAIDLAGEKVRRQLRRYKEKLRDHRPRRGEAAPGTEVEEMAETSYEDVWEDRSEG